MPNPATTTTTAMPVCLACGVIKKSGTMSCCARGGSWFGKCGNAGNANFGHTWHEGIQGCKAGQLQLAVDHQLHASEPNSNDTSGNGSSMDMHANTVVEAAHMFLSVWSNTSTSMSDTSPFTMSVNKAVTMSDRHPIASDGAATPFDATTGAATRPFEHTLVHMLTPKLNIFRSNMTINSSIMHDISTGMSKTTSSHASLSASITARAGEKLQVIAGITALLHMICCYQASGPAV